MSPDPSSGSRGICREKNQRGRTESSWASQLLPGTLGMGQGQPLLPPALPGTARGVSWPCSGGLSQELLLLLNFQTFLTHPFLYRSWALYPPCCQGSFKHQLLDVHLKTITNYQQERESQKICSGFSRAFVQHGGGRAAAPSAAAPQRCSRNTKSQMFPAATVQHGFGDTVCHLGVPPSLLPQR